MGFVTKDFAPRGVLVEEMVDHERELRVLVLHGKVEVASRIVENMI